jgi:hypothetical protein
VVALQPVYRRQSGKRGSAWNAQGIEAESPQTLPQVKYFTCGKVEELERKARFPARSAGNAPKKFLGFYPDEIP